MAYYHNGFGKKNSSQTICLTFWYEPKFLINRYCDKLIIDRITASKREGREFGKKAAATFFGTVICCNAFLNLIEQCTMECRYILSKACCEYCISLLPLKCHHAALTTTKYTFVFGYTLDSIGQKQVRQFSKSEDDFQALLLSQKKAQLTKMILSFRP